MRRRLDGVSSNTSSCHAAPAVDGGAGLPAPEQEGGS